MAETIQNGCDGQPKWHWFNIMKDLETQGGLAGVIIYPTSDDFSYAGITRQGTRFVISWVENLLLMLSLSGEDQSLVDAFAKVVEYRPFCRYLDVNGLPTFEWDKLNPESRFAELQKEGMSQLQKL